MNGESAMMLMMQFHATFVDMINPLDSFNPSHHSLISSFIYDVGTLSERWSFDSYFSYNRIEMDGEAIFMEQVSRYL